ncbi:MAG: dienelactone hydrolase family protein [Flavobacteriales bacterium]|nr:dienelactone hydrolase family protein [Flavobacteriales bacterium]
MKTHLLLVIVALTSVFTVSGQPYSIGSRTITFTDPSRSNRAIECEVYYPATSAGSNTPFAAGQFPLVVVGHGFSMAVTAYQNWWEEFVPQGYIFALPTTEGGLFTVSHGDFGQDLAFVASEIQAGNQNVSSPFYGSVKERTAIMGHSMGGGATVLAASNNTSIDCIVGLAPAETDPSAASAGANVSVPALILHGNEDQVTPEADHALLIYNGLASSCKYYARITEGAHCFFANYNVYCAIGEMNIGDLTREEQQQLSYELVGPWLDYFLNDNCDAYDDFVTEINTNTDLGTNILNCTNDAPVIVDNAGTLESDAQGNYQWYLNGVEIPNADQQTYTYSQAGTYQVGTTNLGNCPILSNEVVVQITGVESIQLTLQRNTPTQIRINSNATLSNVQAVWYDVSGRVIKTETIQPKTNSIVLDKPDFQGVKLLQISSDQTTTSFKVF